jgi:leader peptidase (prepilin peptidase)/N-methyltransferase
MSGFPDWYWSLMGALTGGCLASFLGVVFDRCPRGEGLNGRSKCACGRQLQAHENIPVLGWILAGGTARCCWSRIPVKHPVTEAGGMLMVALLAWFLGGYGVVLAVLVAAATAGAMVLRHRGKRRP